MTKSPIQVGEVTIDDWQSIVVFRKGDLRVDIPRKEWKQLWRNLTIFNGSYCDTNTTTVMDVWHSTALTIQMRFTGGRRMSISSLTLAMDIESTIQDQSISEIQGQYASD